MLRREDGPQTPEEAAREFDVDPVMECPACGYPLDPEAPPPYECGRCGETPASMRAQGWRP